MYIEVNGVTLYYEVWGENGLPLIMVHGNGEDHTIFEEAAEVLSEHYTVFLVDSRGHGQSQPVNDYYYTDMAEDMAQFILALDLAGTTYYGFSDGGIIGLILASEHPELVSQLIVSGANLRPRGVKGWLYNQTRLEYKYTGNPLAKLMLKQPHISPEQLQNIQANTLVLAGSRDVIRLQETQKIAASIPGAELCILQGEDHGSYIIHTDQIAWLLLEFLEERGYVNDEAEYES